MAVKILYSVIHFIYFFLVVVPCNGHIGVDYSVNLLLLLLLFFYFYFFFLKSLNENSFALFLMVKFVSSEDELKFTVSDLNIYVLKCPFLK